MAPFPINKDTSGAPWHGRGGAPGWIILGTAIAFVALGAFAEQIAPRGCRLDESCGPEPFGTLSFGLLAAVAVAAFVFVRATRPIAVAFLLAFAAARIAEVEYVWWVDLAAAGFVVTTLFVTWPRHQTLQGLAAETSVADKAVAADTKLMLVRPGWLLGSGVAAALALTGVAGYLLGRPSDAPEEWLLLTGLAGGLAFALGWRSLDWSIKRRLFLSRSQPARRCTVLPLRFELMVVSEDRRDPVLVVPSSVWEEAHLEKLWVDAGPDGCPGLLYGHPGSGRWAAAEVGGEIMLALAPTWTERRDDALRAAVTLLPHLADAVLRTDVADTIRRIADRYAAEIGEAGNSRPGAGP